MNEVFQQDLSKDMEPGAVFVMHLYMREKCQMPDEATVSAVLQKHLGAVERFTYDPDCIGFAAAKYHGSFSGMQVSPMLMITGCNESKTENIDAFHRSQMWDCPEHERILEECKYEVAAMDMMASALEAADRSEILMNFLAALMELYPTCEAVYFQPSGKMIYADKIRQYNGDPGDRFLLFAVNVRFFRIEGSGDMLVDSLGMSILSMPDLQYHFHGLAPDDVVNHAYNMLAYIIANNCPIRNGDTIDGIHNGKFSRSVQWKCHFEESLVQPRRDVIDICMNKYASGGREYH
ncbi:MAG: DUF4261 domain-containing protein [Oscillospiraceae bacterium]|nr:DUF4261 domain-containing protein [Oscillospiraceae bacterium]